MKRAWLLIIVFAGFSPERAAAQVPQTPAAGQAPAARDVPERIEPLDPDRPDVTNSPHIVGAGRLQIEMGVVHSRFDSGQSSLATPVTARIGIADWLEARVSGDGFVLVRDQAGSSSGLGNVQLGAKLRLHADADGVPIVSLLPTVNLPVASERKGLGSGRADFAITLLAGTDFLTHGHVDVNYGAGWIGAGTRLPRFTQHLVSVSASADLGSVAPYLEGFWFSRQQLDGHNVVAIDGGAIFFINARLAVDCGLQVGLSEAAPSLSAFGGVSLVAGRVFGGHGQRHQARPPSPSKVFAH